MVIAERTLTIKLEGGSRPMAVRIHGPQPHGRAWTCRYEIGWPDGARSMNAEGVDAVQALLLAMQMISAELYASSWHAAGLITFEAPGYGYGFPAPPGLRGDLRPGDRDLCG